VGGVHVVVGTLRVVEAALLVVPAAQGADSVHRAACEMVLQLHEAPLLD
jgi:predicted transcriptional regulator